jgi:hypothetical protein
MKPNTRIVMRALIAQIRETLPFGLPAAETCNGFCDGCSQKLLAYLDSELGAWEQRLDAGEQPTLGDLSRLASTGKKIYAVLKRNGLLAQDRMPAR